MTDPLDSETSVEKAGGGGAERTVGADGRLGEQPESTTANQPGINRQLTKPLASLTGEGWRGGRFGRQD